MTRAPSTIEISAVGLVVTAPYLRDPRIYRRWTDKQDTFTRYLNTLWPVISDRHGELIRGLDIERLSLLKYSGEFPWSF